jgi:hypothetical protein
LPTTLQEILKKNDVIKLVPLNPNVSLAEKDVIKRSLFRNDDKLLNRVKSEEFQEILLTDPTTLDGEAKIVKYFGIAENWATIKDKAKKRTYFRFCIKLLLSVIDC